MFSLKTVAFDDDTDELVVLDQTLLPGRVEYVRLSDAKAVWRAIQTLQVRGAPAIGVAAAYGFYVAARRIADADAAEFLAALSRLKAYLASSRPTAVNLFWALERVEARALAHAGEGVPGILAAMLTEAKSIHTEDAAMCKAIGRHGAALLKDSFGILTHCNAGSLAASAYGTALSPIYVAKEELGFQRLKVFCDETRPLLQGARLTAFELMAAGVDTTLICDNMASIVMRNGWVNAVLAGCDRLAANGDAANKIGTSGVAILARHYGIPFYICLPSSTVDFKSKTGKDIEIELRDPAEVSDLWYKRPMAPKGVKVYNPAFDVTDASLITAIVTERGVVYPPYERTLRNLLDESDSV